MLRFLGLSQEDSAFETSRYAVLPVPYERTTTYGKGTASGPAAIIAASQEVELYDDETQSEPYRAGIHTCDPVACTDLEPETMVEAVRDWASSLISSGKTVIALGGEHSISIGPVAAYSEKFRNLSVLQIDAHADLRESYQASRFSHACAMKRIRDYTARTVGVGIRNYSREEADLIHKQKIQIYHARDIVGRGDWQEAVIDQLTDDVYITIDLDGFDPSMMPGVGTPEPGGMAWHDVVELLKVTAKKRRIVGFDVVELMPISGSLVSEFTAAKLIYKLISYIETNRS